MKSKTWLMAMMAIAVVVGIGSRKAYAVTGNPVDATITVTPTAAVNLNLPTTTYAYGEVATSSQAVSMSSITIINIGDVSVGLDSRIHTEAALWVSSNTTGLINQYSLFVATSTFRPLAADFGVGHRYNAFPGVAKALAGTGGGDPTVAIGSEVNLWFRLDTPTSVSTLAGQTITVRFTGTGE